MDSNVCSLPTAGDSDRAAAFAGMDVSGLVDDPQLTAITDFAAALCAAPVALVSFVEDQRQWFPARTGMVARETPRDVSFCSHAMLTDEIMVVPDATIDPRFVDNPLVTGDLSIRFYAGAPLRTADGIPLGALCVIDRVPREGLTDLQRQGLMVLAGNIVALLAMRKSAANAVRGQVETEAQFRILADTMPQMVWSTRPDGYHDYYNARWYEFTGAAPGSTDGEEWNGMFHPDDQDRAWSIWRHSLETGEPYEIEYRLRDAAGRYRWTLGRALPIRDNDGSITRWFGTCTDVHDSKMAQEQLELISHELSHRIKNIFSVVGGLISLATRSHPETRAVAADLRDRIYALGRAHDFVRPSGNGPARQNGSTFLGLLDELFAPYQVSGRTRIKVHGEDAPVGETMATPLALLFHELATNSAKYGALLAKEGSVDVECRISGEAIEFVWRESGGPPVSAPSSAGFGTKLVELSVVQQLGGTMSRDWDRAGLVVSVTLPIKLAK